MNTVKDIGFEKNGITYSEDRSCLFDNYCTPTDARLWVQHAGAWLTQLAKRYTPARAKEFDRLTHQFAAVGARSEKCTIGCIDDVHAAMSIAKYARALLIAWSHQDRVTVDTPKNDLGWSWPWPHFPVYPGMKDLAHLKWPDLWKLPWGFLLVGGGLLMLALDQEKRKWRRA